MPTSRNKQLKRPGAGRSAPNVLEGIANRGGQLAADLMGHVVSESLAGIFELRPEGRSDRRQAPVPQIRTVIVDRLPPDRPLVEGYKMLPAPKRRGPGRPKGTVVKLKSPSKTKPRKIAPVRTSLRGFTMAGPTIDVET